MLNKTVLGKIFFIAASFLLAGNAFAADLKIGIVDFQRLLSSGAHMEAIKAKGEAKFKSQQAELKSIDSKINELQAKLQKEQLTLTNQQKIDIQRKGQSLQSELQLKQKHFQQDVKSFEQEQLQLLSAKIEKAIEQVAKSQKLDLVLRKAAIAYGDNRADVTDKVLAIIANPAG